MISGINIGLMEFFMGLRLGLKSEITVFNTLICLSFNNIFKYKVINDLTVRKITKHIISDYKTCRGSSNKFDIISSEIEGLKPDWTLIKKSSLNYTGLFDYG